MKIQQPLKALLKKTNLNPEAVKVIRSASVIYQMVKEGAETKVAIDCATVDLLKKRYKGLTFDQLLLVWHENYHSMHIMADEKNEKMRQQNVCSYLVSNKVIAIGILLNDGW